MAAHGGLTVARGGLTAARGGPIVARGSAKACSAVQTTTELTGIYFQTFSVGG